MPLQTQQIPISSTPEYSSITGTAILATITPPANTNLRKLKLLFSENSTLAAAGTDLLTVTLNAVVIYKANIYLPATAGAILSNAGEFDLNFDMLGLNAGAAGTLTVALATALATGILDINAYFD